MKNKKGFTLVEILVVIAIIALLFGIGVPSYMLITKNMKQKSYENKVSYALTKAEEWASATGRSAVNIGHLIEEGYMEPDNEEGAYNNPVDNSSMLCYTIRIDYNDNQYNANLSGEEYCDYAELEAQTSIIELVQLNSQGSVLENDAWTRDDVLLRVQFKTNEDLNRYQDSIQEIVWKGNSQTERVLLNQDFSTKNQYTIQVAQFMNTRYEVSMKIVYEGKTYIYKAYTQVKIDRQNPIVYQDEINVEHYDEWQNNAKDVKIITSDLDGSGIYGYYVGTSNATCNPNKSAYQPLNSGTISLSLNQGEYYACVMDNVGNVSEVTKIFVDKVDKTAPTITGYTIYSQTLNGTYYSSLSLKVGVRDVDSGVSGIKYCITTSSSCNPTTIYNVDTNGDIVIPFSTPNKNPQKVCVKGLDRAGNESSLVCSNGYLFDNTAPIIQSFDFSSTNHKYVVSFNASDAESGIYRYQIILKDEGDGSEKVYHSTTSGTLTFQDLPYNHRYTIKLQVTNNAGLTTEAPTIHHFKTEITMKEAQNMCNISNGYCNNGVYVKYHGHIFVLYRATENSVFGLNISNDMTATLLVGNCCDAGYCKASNVWSLEWSGIYSDGNFKGWGSDEWSTHPSKTVKQYFDTFTDSSIYLNKEDYYFGEVTWIKINIEEEERPWDLVTFIPNGKYISIDPPTYESKKVMKASYGLLDYQEYINIYRKSYYPSNFSTMLSTVHPYCYANQGNSAAEAKEDSHFTCMGSTFSPMALYLTKDKLQFVSVVYNHGYYNAAMTVPFKNDIVFTGGSGTLDDPFVF